MVDVEKVIDKLIELRNREPDPIAYRKMLGIDPYKFGEIEITRTRLPLFTAEIKARWERKLYELGI
jgi:hypothetical protein